MSPGRTKLNGAGDRIRTGDINLGKVALYQLSYSREGTANRHEANVPYDLLSRAGSENCQTRRAAVESACSVKRPED